MSVVNDVVLTYLPAKRKQTPSGWLSFNAPCCHHNGTSADTRQRGGLISNPDGGVSFHCFNCGFKASWQPGRNLSHKLRKLLQWMGAPDDVINRVALDVMRENEGVESKTAQVQLPSFHSVPLPEDAVKFADMTGTDQIPQGMIDTARYMQSRDLFIEDYDFYWSPASGYRDRLIIPFYYEGRIVGWTARKCRDGKPKYLSEQQPGYVFNLDNQGYNKQFAIVCEGPIDAIHVQGTALLGSEIKDSQALLLNRLNRDIIVVPDRDSAGKKLVQQAIDLEWSVSMPNWDREINDIGDAVAKYGRLYTLYSIATQAERSSVKIKLQAKTWFN